MMKAMTHNKISLHKAIGFSFAMDEFRPNKTKYYIFPQKVIRLSFHTAPVAIKSGSIRRIPLERLSDFLLVVIYMACGGKPLGG